MAKEENCVAKVNFEGREVSSPSDVKKAIFEHFKRHFEDSFGRRPVVGNLEVEKLSDGQVLKLEDEFSKEEVFQVVNECKGGKVPRPVGFNFKFIQEKWQWLKDNVMNFMRDFHTSGILGDGLNVSFISLIPKVANPVSINYFRPISLVGSIYKILAKTLANRLKCVLGPLISDTQSAFLKGGKFWTVL